MSVSHNGLYTYPDVFVVCGESKLLDGHKDTLLNPVLIAEVLSPSTERYDRIFKFSQSAATSRSRISALPGA